MTLDDLLARAERFKREALAFADANCPKEGARLLITLEEFRDSWVLSIARRNVDGRRNKRGGNLDVLDHKIVKAGEATDLYFYAKQHGVDAAMIWKLSK